MDPCQLVVFVMLAFLLASGFYFYILLIPQYRNKRNVFYQQGHEIEILIIWSREKVILINGGREKVILTRGRKKINGAGGRRPKAGAGVIVQRKVIPESLK